MEEGREGGEEGEKKKAVQERGREEINVEIQSWIPKIKVPGSW